MHNCYNALRDRSSKGEEIANRNFCLGNKQTKKIKHEQKSVGRTISFVQQMRTYKCHLFGASMQQRVPRGTQQDFNCGSET